MFGIESFSGQQTNGALMICNNASAAAISSGSGKKRRRVSEEVQIGAAKKTPCTYTKISGTHAESKSKGSRNVRFAPQTSLKTIESSSTMTPTEKLPLWYTEKEISDMQSLVRKVSIEFRSRQDHRAANVQSIEDCDEAGVKEKDIMRAMLARQVQKDKKETSAHTCILSSSPDTAMCFTNESEDIEQEQQQKDDQQPIPRGLEQRISFRRQWKKFQSVRWVLECQCILRDDQKKEKEKSNVGLGQKRPDPSATSTKSQQHDKDTDEMAAKLARAASKCSGWAKDVALATGQTDMLEVYPEMASVVYSRSPRPEESGKVSSALRPVSPQVATVLADLEKSTCNSGAEPIAHTTATRPILARDSSVQASVISISEDEHDGETADMTASQPFCKDSGNGCFKTSNSNLDEMHDFLNSSYCALFDA